MKKSTAADFPIAEDAGLSQFAILERPAPAEVEGRAVVRIRAAALNPLDLRVQAGLFPYSIPGPLVLGNEGAGVVEHSRRFPKGTRVMIMGFPLGVSEDGTHQELMSVPEEWLYPLPSPFSFEEGAAFLVAYATAQCALTYAAKLQAGDYVFVTGATGTIGRAAVQLTSAQGAHPISVVSRPDKVAVAKADAPYAVVDRSTESVEAAVLRLTDGKGASIGVDPVGGKDMGRLLPALRRGGTLVCVGYLAGKMAQIVIPLLVGWSRALVGVDLFETPAPDLERALRQIGELAEQGKLRPAIDSVYPLADYPAAFARVASRKAVGKVILTL
jgi:NADPH2:quinone reductase